jgi:hypothetical protein
VVAIEEAPADLGALRDYLATIARAGCETVILDASPAPQFEEHRRVLRWVARHLPLETPCDFLRAAAAAASCDAVVVADVAVRYTPAAIAAICEQLDGHDVVEPQEYLDPMPWWSGIDAARMLLRRGVPPLREPVRTFAFRQKVARALFPHELLGESDPVRRLHRIGFDVHAAPELFVRREPPALAEWLRERPANSDGAAVPVRSALLVALLPIAVVLALVAGLKAAAGYAGALALGTVALAFRGRRGARMVFPLRACFFAPLSLLDRSIGVYVALWRRMRRKGGVTSRPDESERAARIASGE